MVPQTATLFVARNVRGNIGEWRVYECVCVVVFLLCIVRYHLNVTSAVQVRLIDASQQQ